MQVLTAFLKVQSYYDSSAQYRPHNHASIVKECVRLFANDDLWQK